MMGGGIRYLDQLLDENKPVWVKNIHKPRGNVILTFTDRSGRTDKLDVPPVKHPICLTHRVTPDSLRGSRDLRDLLARKVLVLVSPAEAEAYYDIHPNADDDVNRAYLNLSTGNPEIRKMRETGREEDDRLLYTHSQGDALVVGKNPAGPQSLQEKTDEIGFVSAEEDGDVQSRVKVLIDALASKDKKAREVRSELEALELSDSDLAYIIDNCEGLVEKYAKQEFATRRGEKVSFDDEE